MDPRVGVGSRDNVEYCAGLSYYKLPVFAVYLLTFIYFSMVQYKVFKPYGHRNGHIIYTHSTSDCKIQFKSVD